MERQPTDSLKPGDTVVHARRPEWGSGVVDRVQAIVYEGKPAQRLVVQFVHKGRVTVNSAVAPLRRIEKDGKKGMTTSSYATSGVGGASVDPLGSAFSRREAVVLWALPEALTDPFNGLRGRLAATVDTYRFNAPPPNSQRPRSPGSLLDWAIGQTQQDDPLVHHSRQELEQAFARFSRDRDVHLAQLVESAKKQGKGEVVAELLAETTDPAAKRGLSEAMRRVGL